MNFDIRNQRKTRKPSEKPKMFEVRRNNLEGSRPHLRCPKWCSDMFKDIMKSDQNVSVLQRFLLTSELLVWTIRKSIKNNENTYSTYFVSWIWARDIKGQRGVRSWDWRTPLSQSGAPWWPGGECFAPLSADLTLVSARCLEHSLGGGRRPSPPEDFSGLLQTYDFSSSFTALFRKRTFLC